MTSTQANANAAAQVFTNAPWLEGVTVYEFTTNASFEEGLAAGEQLAHVSPDAASASYGSWLMLQNSLSAYPNAGYMTPAEIQDAWAIPNAPAFMTPVTSIPVGTPMLMGAAAPVSGWGSGGGIQFFVQSGSSTVTFGTPQALP
jgi:hypothetical protein